MIDTIYMLSSSRYWSGLYPETFATDAAGIEKIVRQQCRRWGYEVKLVKIDRAAGTATVFTTNEGWCRTFHILVVERI